MEDPTQCWRFTLIWQQLLSIVCIDKAAPILWEYLMQPAVRSLQSLLNFNTGWVGAVTYTAAAAIQSGETHISWSLS